MSMQMILFIHISDIYQTWFFDFDKFWILKLISKFYIKP
jgi:hypothetical protein